MGIDADFWFSIPDDADFPDDVTIERDGDTETYFHRGIVFETEKDLKAARDALEQAQAALRAIRHEAAHADVSNIVADKIHGIANNALQSAGDTTS